MSPRKPASASIAVQWTCLLSLCLSSFGCGGGGGGGSAPPALPPETDDQLVFETNRDPATGQILAILQESGAGFDAIEVDSPAVVVDSGRPGADKFLMYYEATAANGDTTIGVISSDEEDFSTLTVGRTQAVALGAAMSGYEGAATDPTVLVDKSVPFGMAGRYHMWFEGRSGAGNSVSTIIHATSADGVTWSNFMSCMGLNPAYGMVRVADPTVIDDGGTFRMWFEAINTLSMGGGDGPGVIGTAESMDGIVWVVTDANGNMGAAAASIFGVGDAGSFDAFSVGAPTVVLDETVAVATAGRYKLWYEAGDTESDTQNTIGYATSADGLTWSNPQLPLLVPSSDSLMPLPFDSGDLEHPAAVLVESIAANQIGRYLLYHTGDGENGASPNRIGLRRGRDGP